MSLPSKVNKENFRLLDLSSDEESDDLHLEIIPSRKKKVTRRERSRGITPKIAEPNIGAEVRCALRWAVRGTLLLWLLMLTWICAALYDQMSTMKIDIAKVSTNSGSVGDELQKCHSDAKELRASATNLTERLTKLEQDHQELVKRVEQARADLTAVTSKLAAAPMLAETPQRLAALEHTVGLFGSSLKGWEGSLDTYRKQAIAASSGVEEIKALLQQLHAKSNETIANVSANMRGEDELRAQVAALNNTLAARVDALQTRIEEISKPTSTAVPATSPTTTSTTSTTTTTTTPASPVPLGPPTKPSVLGSVQ